MGAKHSSFKRKLLATSISSCILATASAGVSAQDDKVLEEVLVTGIRASLENAMDIKRDSAGVVDAISAEDIGKMPDTNLAESLQRVTGVSISRVNGEGEKITVRGIDPALNLVLLNGRTMPAVTNDGTADDTASRAFDFANLASEVVRGVEIYKTGKASLPSGGLGATVNVKTVRPLDLGDSKFTVGAKAIHDTTVTRKDAEGDKITPELSGLASWLNEEGTFGVSIAAAYQKRENARANAFVNNWNLTEAGAPTYNTEDENDPNRYQLTHDGNIPYYSAVIMRDTDGDGVEEPVNADLTDPAQRQLVDVTNVPTAGTFYNMPTDIRYVLEDNTRVRKNGVLTIQYQPVERVTATMDYFYSSNELDAQRAQQSTWFNVPQIDSVVFDTNVVKTPLIFHESYPGGADVYKDVSFAQQTFQAETQNNSFGINLLYDVTDDFQLELDYHDSRAKNVAYRPEAGLNANVVTEEYADFRFDMPLMGVAIDDSSPAKGNNNGILDGGDVSGAMGTIQYSEQSTEIQQLRLMGSYDLGDLGFFQESKLSFGIESREDTNNALRGNGESPRIVMGNWGGVDPDQFGSDWPSYWTGRNFAEGFPDFDETTGDQRFLDSGLEADMSKIMEKMEFMYHAARVSDSDDILASNFADFPNGKFQFNGVINTAREVTEEVKGAYIHFASAMNIAGMDANLGLGLRYEETETTSGTSVAEPENLEWQSDDDWVVLLSNRGPQPFSRSGSYDNLMPNVDFNIAPMEDLVVRASYSKTIGRAAYNDLRADVFIESAHLLTATAGDPGLNPMESDNIDLSLEWYYGDLSYVSAGYFIKDVSNFIGYTSIPGQNWYDLRDPRQGPRADQARETIIADGGSVTPGTLHTELLIIEGKDPAQESTSVYPIVTEGDPLRDPLAEFSTTTPVNDKDAKIDGVELAVQHWFGETGFGVQANYTMVDSDVGFDVTSTETQFSMLGLSDSANLIGFYDKGDWQLRIAYNWRDTYLNDRTKSGGNEPEFIDEFSQIDFSAGYELNDMVSFTFEGLNITGEDSRTYGRSEAQLYSLEDLGARYQLGMRVTF